MGVVVVGWCCGSLQRVCHTNSPRFEQVAVPLNPFVDESAPSDRADFDCPVKIEIFRTKPEAETSTSKDGATRAMPRL
jgi:hypothetical protein